MSKYMNYDAKEAAYRSIFYSFFATLFIGSYLEESSPQMESRYEKYGFGGHKTFGGRLKYVTIINLVALMVYFSLAAVNAVFELICILRNQTKTLDRFRLKYKLNETCNSIYIGIAFPSAVFVVTKFWGLYLYERNTVFSELLEKVIPWHQNHIMHTVPLVAVVLDDYLFKHHYPQKSLKGARITIIYSISCLTWILMVAHFAGIWVYPFIGQMGVIYRTIFLTAASSYLIMLYKLGEVLNRWIWD